MNRKAIFFVFSMLMACQIAVGQSLPDKVLLTVDNTPIAVDEFKSIYLKNNTPENKIDRATLDEYLRLFINFKLKVHEAEIQKLDTSAAFKTEYEGYIKQLAQPYLTDASSDDHLIDEAYQRMQQEVGASHILIKVPENATPEDTLKLYRKALDARNRILRGESFASVALAVSEDPSVKRNSGYLGYFTVFQMVYPFETAAYNTPKDSISMPVRSRFGYHIIKVLDKRPAQGKVKVAHIMIRTQPNFTPQQAEDARKKILDIEQRLKNGEDFATLAKKESQDPGTAKNGGEFPWLSAGQIIPEFEKVAFGLTYDGQISEPFQSDYGWHIVKRIARKNIGTKEEMLPEIKSMIARDSRNQQSKELFIKRLKKEYNFTEDTVKLDILKPLVDSTILKAAWKSPVLKTDPVIFSFAGGSYKLSNLARFIEDNQQRLAQVNFKNIVSVAYGALVIQTLSDFEESKLPQKYPEFKQLAKEYYEGMLLFDITNRMVWQKSADSVGIADYYNAHKDQYKWGDRVHYVVYTLNNNKIKDKFVSGLSKRKVKKINPQDYANTFTQKDKTIEINVDPRVATTDNSDIKDYKLWQKGVKVSEGSDGKIIVTEIVETSNGDQKDLSDCRGQVVADYQESIENDWVNSLKVKYSVNLNNAVYEELVASILGKN